MVIINTKKLKKILPTGIRTKDTHIHECGALTTATNVIRKPLKSIETKKHQLHLN